MAGNADIIDIVPKAKAEVKPAKDGFFARARSKESFFPQEESRAFERDLTKAAKSMKSDQKESTDKSSSAMQAGGIKGQKNHALENASSTSGQANTAKTKSESADNQIAGENSEFEKATNDGLQKSADNAKIEKLNKQIQQEIEELSKKENISDAEAQVLMEMLQSLGVLMQGVENYTTQISVVQINVEFTIESGTMAEGSALGLPADFGSVMDKFAKVFQRILGNLQQQLHEAGEGQGKVADFLKNLQQQLDAFQLEKQDTPREALLNFVDGLRKEVAELFGVTDLEQSIQTGYSKIEVLAKQIQINLQNTEPKSAVEVTDVSLQGEKETAGINPLHSGDEKPKGEKGDHSDKQNGEFFSDKKGLKLQNNSKPESEFKTAQGDSEKKEPRAILQEGEAKEKNAAQATAVKGSETNILPESVNSAANSVNGAERSDSVQSMSKTDGPFLRSRGLDVAVLRQVGDQIRMMAKDGKHIMTIRLQPEELGKVELRVEMENKNLRIHMTVENESVRHLMENRIPQLREMLDAQQVQMDRMEVMVQKERSQMQERQQKGGGRKGRRHRGEEEGLIVRVDPGDQDTGRRLGYNTMEVVA